MTFAQDIVDFDGKFGIRGRATLPEFESVESECCQEMALDCSKKEQEKELKKKKKKKEEKKKKKKKKKKKIRFNDTNGGRERVVRDDLR